MSSCSVTNGNRTAQAANCPECDRRGRHVDSITVKALLRPGALARLENVAYSFCPTPGCPVVYFSHEAAGVYPQEDLKGRVGLKEADDPLPISSCFVHTPPRARPKI